MPVLFSDDDGDTTTTMTVSELIEELRKHSPDAAVTTSGDDVDLPVTEVIRQPDGTVHLFP